MSGLPTIDDIRQIEKPVDRLGQLAEALAAAERYVAAVRKLRDDAIKEYRATDDTATARQIATAAGVSVATVKAVLR
jgi:hypothetical protein